LDIYICVAWYSMLN